MKYRKEIDGLRAVAVLPVILFHAGYSFFKGGFLGVDIFFVISGYLITSIILREKESGTFSLLNFYERRARRILPALFFVIACSIPVAWFLMVPHQLKDFSQSLVSVATYTSNIFFYLESGYFETAAETKPLLHTWSLAVEEQFYIFFPLLFSICWIFPKDSSSKRNTLFFVSLILCVFSLLFSEWAVRNNPSANFFLAPMRAWELLVGSMLALYMGSASDSRLKGNNILASLGLLMVVFSIAFFDDSTPHPSLYTLIPVIGTALIILFAQSSNFTGRLLSFKFLVGIGLISYSAYLWHVPLFAFLRIYTFNLMSSFQINLVILLSFVLAYFSWKYVETPFRSKGTVRNSYFFTMISIFSFALLLAGIYGHKTNGYYDLKVSSLSVNARELIIDREEEVRRRGEQWPELLDVSYQPFNLPFSKSKVLILGDSKSEDLYVGLKVNSSLFQDYDFRRVKLAEKCYSTLLDSLKNPDNINVNTNECELAVQTLVKNRTLEEADIVVMANTWWSRRPEYFKKITELSNFLSTDNKKVLILGTGNFNDLSSLSMLIAKRSLNKDEASYLLYENRRSDTKNISDRLALSVKGISGVTFVNKYEIFCDNSERICNLFDANNRPYIYDTGHVTVEGARYLGKRIFELGWF